MALINYVDGGPPTIDADWLNAVDVLLQTVFGNATTPALARTALGGTATGVSIFTAADAAAVLTALGATATGQALLAAASAAAGRTALGAGATGSAVFVAANAAAAFAALGATSTGTDLMTAATAAAARGVLGLTSPYDWMIACSDETTDIVAAVAVVTFRMPREFTLSSVKASLNAASSSGIVTIDIKLAGVSIFSTLLTIDESETTSVTAATPAVLSTTAMTADALMTIDITTDGTAAKGLKVTFLGTLP